MNSAQRRTSPWRFNASAVALAFGTYFCMYAFRKPFAAASYPGAPLLGLKLKTAFVVSQIIGYTCSKYWAVKLVSEASRARRWPMLIGVVVVAELSLLGFAVLPAPLKLVAIFLNGLPLGMVWGLVVRYLEGRRTSEFLLAGLSASFIVASGAVKDVGRFLLSAGLGVYWMPFVAGLLFLIPFTLLSRSLDRLPDPDADDVRLRVERTPMSAARRRQFFTRYAPGLVVLLLVYLGLTAFRDFRDNFGVEIFAGLGYSDQPALFTATEVPVALLVLVTLAALGLLKDPLTGLGALFALMVSGLLLLGGATFLLQQNRLSGATWMVLMGFGAYLAYVPFSSFLFDRITVATRFTGTAVFAINLADATGYSGSVALQLYKDVFAGGISHLGFFISVSYALAALGSIGLAFAGLYFMRAARAAHSA
jgi:Family of unknown function (DUF5690)